MNKKRIIVIIGYITTEWW